MKKIFLFVKGAKRWNSLLNKFSKLHKRLQSLLDGDNTRQYDKLVKKLQGVYSKLEKMQYQTGVKIATTSLTVILSAFTAHAQFAAEEIVQQGAAISLAYYAAPTFADIDGDGDLDAYIGSQYGDINVFINNGGVFTENPDLQAGGTDIDVGNNSTPAFADIDGDGDLDLYVGNRDGEIKVFTNNTGVFTAAPDLQADGTNIDVGFIASPTFADIDGDGDLDLYVGENTGSINVFTNSAGVFTAAPDLQADGTDIVVGWYSSPSFADIDGDGDLDLYVGEYYGAIKAFTNDAGVFTAASDLQADGANISLPYAPKPTFADIDGDGDLDLYVGKYYGNIGVFKNNAGVFTTAVSELQAGGANIDIGNRSEPTFADIDGDGDSDLYVGENGGEISVFNNSLGVFSDLPDLHAGGTVIDVLYNSNPTFADIDGDGDFDLYVGEGNGAIKVFTNNAGDFTQVSDLQAGSTDIDVGYTASPTFADIDGDGDLDLYVGEYYGYIKVFTNSTGVFTAASNLQADGTDINVGYTASPTFADIDGDGDLDLYVGENGGSIKVFTNSAGIFTAASDLQAGGADIDVGTYSSPTFEDVDGDSDLDLYVGNNYGTILFFENTTSASVLVSSITVQGQGGVSTITTQGGTLQMEATVLPANADDATYTWSVTNGTGSASIDANGVLTATGDGTVIVTATANDGSGETATFEVTISNQTTQAILVNSITVQGQGGVSTITTQGGTLQMEATVLPMNADDATYTWSVTNGTGSATIDANGLLTATGDGTVTVTATANDGSGETATFEVTISNQTVGIKDIAFDNLNVYPNPTTGIVNISVSNEEITSIRLFDLSGRVVKQYGNESQINVSDITTGIYMLEIANDDKRSIVKLIVR